MNLNGKRIDQPQLLRELAAAGVSVEMLGTDGDVLHTFDAQGVAQPLPAAARAVIDAHVPPPLYVAPDYGDDVPDDRSGGQVAQAVANLRQYLGTANPTQAQSTAALRLLIRLVLLLARRTLRANAGA